MRRPLALALGLCVCASPALAGIAQITGTGPGGSIANVTFGAGTTASLVTTAIIPAGSLVVIIAQNATAGTSGGFSASDTHSNSYTAPRAVDASNGGATQILYSFTGTTINNGDTITLTQTSGPSGITGQVVAFSGAASSPYDISSGNSGTSVTGTGIGIGSTGPFACPGGGAGCEVIVAGTNLRTSGTITQDANYHDIASGVGQSWGNAFWIIGATTSESFLPSTTSTTNFGAQLAAFKAAVASSYGGGTTVGVGH